MDTIFCSECDDHMEFTERSDWLVNAEKHVTTYYCTGCGLYLGVEK